MFKNQRELFFHIWQIREHYCVNCRKYLGNEAKAHYFDHIKTKGSSPELKLDPDNIQLLCMDCHYAKHSNPDIYRNRTR